MKRIAHPEKCHANGAYLTATTLSPLYALKMHKVPTSVRDYKAMLTSD
jgi:hypothetical protein